MQPAWVSPGAARSTGPCGALLWEKDEMGRARKFASAVREAASAVTAWRPPGDASLRRLGIDPDQANRISF